MRKLIPYSEFTGQMLQDSIRHATTSIEQLEALDDNPRAEWSIRVLNDNLVVLRSHFNMYRGKKP